METKKSVFKLPNITLSPKKTKLVQKFSQPLSLSPSFPSLERSLKQLSLREIQSPNLTHLPRKSKLTTLPSKLLNPSGFLRKLNESPIKANQRHDSQDEDFAPIFNEMENFL